MPAKQTTRADAANRDDIDICYEEFPNGYVGEHFTSNANRKFNPDIFTKEELSVLETVATKFADTNTNKIVDISHEEKAWLDNIEGFNGINYKYGFELKNV